MQKGSTIFLRVAVLAVGTVVSLLCIFALPHMWRTAHLEEPDITYALYGILTALYVSVVPFFVALWQTIKLLGYVDANKAFSTLSVRALKNIKYCALAISTIYAATVPFLYIWAEKDDAPGLIVIGMVLTLAPVAVGVFAGVLQRLLAQAIAIKKENDLTV